MAEIRVAETVGPVLENGPAGDAVIAAIRKLNDNVTIEDRGSYVRVLVPRRCVVTREAIEAVTGQSFALPADLELVMPSFKGRFLVNEDQATWTAENAR
ncbi:MAG TPA: MmoB/DmpM family protein [Nevskiaceae bacterium]|nr:MmoB/DmpM family protein [Nevskiaceae bacterium]